MSFVIKRSDANITLYFSGLDKQGRALESQNCKAAFRFETLREAMQVRDGTYSRRAEIVNLDRPKKGKTQTISLGFRSGQRSTRRQPDMQGRRVPVLTAKQLAKLAKKTTKEEE